MPGEYSDILALSSLRPEGAPLTALGGYDNADARSRLSAEMYNQAVGAIVDLVNDRWKSVDPEWFSLTDINDGSADAYSAFQAAFTWAVSNGRDVDIRGHGTYSLSQAVRIASATGMRVRGNPAAVVEFPSSDTSIGVDASYGSVAAYKRSAFYLTGCDGVAFEAVRMQGDDVETDIAKNIGYGISGTTSTNCRVTRCHWLYGASLVSTDSSSDNWVVSENYVYGARLGSRLGNHGVFTCNKWKLPNTAAWDRSTNPDLSVHGSSHAIYGFSSSGQYWSIIGDTFENIRLDAIKVSGSSSALIGCLVIGCKFYNCGKSSTGASASGCCFAFGADDVQSHSVATFADNHVYDCGQVVQIYGARGYKVDHNNISWSTAPAFVTSRVIQVSRYSATSQAVETGSVHNNTMTAPSTIGGGVIATYGISVQNGGITSTSSASSTAHNSVDISDNKISWCCSQAIETTSCLSPTIVDNVITGVATFLGMTGDRMPWVVRNRVINPQSSNAQIRQTFVSFPYFRDNLGCGKVGLYFGKVGIGNNAGAGTSVQYPLCGASGKASPSEGKPEIVFAWGYNQISGDTIDFNGTTLTYVTSAPGANQFSTFAELLALINSLGGGTLYSAADYGDAHGGITTYHIRVRRQTAVATPNLFYVKPTTKHPTAFVYLPNYNTNSDRCMSRGEGTTDVVVWSQAAQLVSPPLLMPDYDSTIAQTRLSASCPMPHLSEAGDEQACCTLRVSGLDGTERFIWKT
jgi:hypothetical protein